ncbi:MAG: glycosyltransferase family 4 protein [Anaerolineae bacterium]|nr:glycosyltransferase family 4 protein [Anaerolineae bacterium]
MRIGIVTGEYPPMEGGVGAFSQILAHTLHDQGHHVALFSRAGAQAAPGLPLTHTATWGAGGLRALRDWARRERPDIVALQFQTAAYDMSPWVHFLPRALRPLPVVTTFHDLRFPYLFPKAGPLRDWIVMHLARHSAGVIVTNHEDAARVAPLPRHTLIPIGSNILTDLPADYDRADWRAQAGAAAGEVLLAYFGFINRSKGLETLLDSLAHLRAGGVAARLVLIGGRTGASDPTNAAFAAAIDRRIQTLRLGEQITWTGFVTETAVSAFLHAADLVVLPFLDGASYRRGTLMAAVHHGCAIITTTPAVPVPDFITGENMLLVPPGNAGALAAAIRRAAASPALHDRLRQGAARLREQFDWQNIARATADFYARILQEAA